MLRKFAEWIRRQSKQSSGILPGTLPANESGQNHRADSVELIGAMAQRMVDVVNESMTIANGSKNIETRRSRVRVARDTLHRLLELAGDYPFIKVQRLVDVERDIGKIDAETDQLEADKQEVASWKEIRGYRFQARPSLSTPLTTLMRHGEEQPAVGCELVSYPGGNWSPIRAPFGEVMAEVFGEHVRKKSEVLDRHIGASEVGSVDIDELVRFIVATKQAAMGDGSIEERAWQVDAVANLEENRRYTDGYGGVSALIERIFPKVLDKIDGIPPLIKADLYKLDLRTVAAIDAAPDDRLLAIEGMGKQRLRKLRGWCATYEGDRNEDRIEPSHAAMLDGYIW